MRKAEDGFAAGRDSLWIGVLDGWDWQFWEFGRFMVMMILGSLSAIDW